MKLTVTVQIKDFLQWHNSDLLHLHSKLMFSRFRFYGAYQESGSEVVRMRVMCTRPSSFLCKVPIKTVQQQYSWELKRSTLCSWHSLSLTQSFIKISTGDIATCKQLCNVLKVYDDNDGDFVFINKKVAVPNMTKAGDCLGERRLMGSDRRVQFSCGHTDRSWYKLTPVDFTLKFYTVLRHGERREVRV